MDTDSTPSEHQASRPTRRAVLQVALVGGALVATWDGVAGAPTALAVVPQAEPARAVVAAFYDPASDARPKLRWWWPHGLVDIAEIEREVDQMAAAGFGGAEIEDVHHSVHVAMDTEGHGWGTPSWVGAVEAAVARASQHGMTMDIAIGPCWPAAVPTIAPDSVGAAKELVHGRQLVQGGATYSGAVPLPYVAAKPGVITQDLLAVHALRIDPASSPTAKTVLLLKESLVDLTDTVVDGQISWTAPVGGQWLMLAYRVRGTGQLPEAGPHTSPDSYVIDHFSPTGAKAVIDFWESRILTDRLRLLLKKAGGAIFEDSLEFEATTYWTPRLLQEFEARKGYSLMAYLPVIVREKEKFTLAYDAETSRRVLNDYWDVLGRLYIDSHVVPVRDWAHGLGMQLRVQPYGLKTDAMAAAAALDISEGESLGFKNLDDYRSLAGGRDMAGKKILSNEAAAFAASAYTVSWDRVLRTLNPIFSAGVNQSVLHGFSYSDAPEATWPGFAAFTPYSGKIGYSESWGPRQPTWRHVADISAYLGRTQMVLQSGTPKVDVAFLRQKGYAGSGFGAAWFSADGVQLGWTLGFVAPSLLELPSAVVRDGRLNPEGPAYKVLVFEGDAFSGNAAVMPTDTAKRLVELARAGLPMIVVGDWSSVHAYGQAEAGDNGQLRELFAQLLALPNVVDVAARANVPDGLATLGLEPTVRYDAKALLLTARRVDADIDYFFFVNSSPTLAVDQFVTLPKVDAGSLPYVLDTWTGEVSSIGLYEDNSDAVRVRVRLLAGQTTVVALASAGRLGGAGPDLHAVSSNAPEVRAEGGRLLVRSTVNGSYTTALSNGRSVPTEVEGLPASVNLDAWELNVDEVLPGNTATETTTVSHRLSISPLAPWPQLPGLADAAGVGRYTTTVHIDHGWSSVDGAFLDLGEVLDTFRVSVNGRRMPPADLLGTVVDLGDSLRPGDNLLEVEVATTLINRLRVVQPDVYGVAASQRYGLVGPVRLIPYTDRQLPSQ